MLTDCTNTYYRYIVFIDNWNYLIRENSTSSVGVRFHIQLNRATIDIYFLTSPIRISGTVAFLL